MNDRFRQRPAQRGAAGGESSRTAYRESRQRSERFGRRAEWIAAVFLWAKGYRLLARRVRTPVGEIDLVVRKGNTLVFVEVKARPGLDSAIFALHPRQCQRIEAASRVLAPRFAGPGTTMRIDAVLVRPWALPVHMVAIWREQG